MCGFYVRSNGISPICRERMSTVNGCEWCKLLSIFFHSFIISFIYKVEFVQFVFYESTTLLYVAHVFLSCLSYRDHIRFWSIHRMEQSTEFKWFHFSIFISNLWHYLNHFIHSSILSEFRKFRLLFSRFAIFGQKSN